MELVSNDEFVVFVCTDPSSTEADSAQSEIFISTLDILNWDLPTILSFRKVKIRAHRDRLIEQSSYFRGLLSGSYSESCLDSISILWNPSTFIDVLKCIYGCQLEVEADNFLLLLEAALYFGVEILLLKCKAWFSDVSSSTEHGQLKLQLDDLIYIWNYGLEHANEFIPELCASYLARNFMWAISSESFESVPYDLLLSCTKHPLLTVDSEMHISDALLVWLNQNADKLECLEKSGYDCRVLLNQIRIGLLPLWFAAGKRRSCHFSDLAVESTHSIFEILKNPSLGFFYVRDHDFLNFRIRLTKYSKIVNLSGCPQITSAFILLSVLPSSHTMDPKLRRTQHFSEILQCLERDQLRISQSLLPTLSFEAVHEVDISKCPRIHLQTAIECFHKSFPSLRTVKATHHLNFNTTMLLQLLQKCPLVCEVDLTVDISPVKSGHVTVISSSIDSSLPISDKSCSSLDNLLEHTIPYQEIPAGFAPPMSNITKLTLEGRTIGDLDLMKISTFCVSLHYLNIKGCIGVTDVGISGLLYKCKGLHSIFFCHTHFGINSVTALCSGISSNVNFAAEYGNYSDSLAFNLLALHMGGCRGPDEASLLQLLSQTQMLKSLCLRGTHLNDHVFYSFTGSSLETLDVSNTEISGAALGHIIRRNPSLKILKARGCRNLVQPTSNTAGEEFYSPYLSKGLYNELGKICRLEEIRLGWGFSFISLEAMKPSILSLRTLVVGLGGSLGEDALIRIPEACPALESVILHFQIISDRIMHSIITSLRKLQVLALCYCLGDITISSFKFSMPNLRKLRLERVTPWMTNAMLEILTQNCTNLIELSLLGCTLLDAESQKIISRGWPGLLSIHLEECGQVTTKGVASLLDCRALEDLLLRHNGNGIPRNFIVDAASKLPLLRKLSLDMCDASEGEFDIPDYSDRGFLSTVTLARCKSQRCTSYLPLPVTPRRAVHKETLTLAWTRLGLINVVVKERL